MESRTQIYANTVFSMLSTLDTYPQHALHFGLTDDLIESFSQLNLREQKHLAASAEDFLFIEFDAEKLTNKFHSVRVYRAERDLEDRFILQNATSKMMHTLFGMNTNEFCRRRSFLGLAGQGRHRPQSCDEQTKDWVLTHWAALEHIELRMRYLKVAELTRQPLNIIWAVIRENHRGNPRKLA